ncbi:MAG: type IV pilus biogenesis/stability protein PilW [Chitinimonas sp.]|nr:type IV pilus biogenesis/stability protein PilW [Chitinimonas sp.]
MKKAVIAALLFAWIIPAVQADEQVNRDEVARLRTELAAAYYARGQYGVALEEVKSALRAKADYALAHNVEGLVYSDLREYDTADKSFQRALSLASGNPDINHNYGWFLCNKREKYADSLRYFGNAIRSPLYANPQKSMQMAGLCALKAGDLKYAEDFLRQSDRAQPDNAQTLLGLAQVAYRNGDIDAARTLLARQARVGTPVAEALWLNVRIEHKLNPGGEAENGFAKELKTRFPNSEEARSLAAGRYD